MNLLGISTIIKNGEDSRKNHAVFKVDSQQIIQAIRSVVEPIPTGNFTDSNQSSDTNLQQKSCLCLLNSGPRLNFTLELKL